MPLLSAGYQPRDAERGVLYRIVDAQLDAFLDATAHHAEGARLTFVEQEFRDFLTCGVVAYGFARLRCGECALRAARAVLLQGPRLLPELRRAGA